jgi:glucose/arabinose dehydrogenase
MATGLWLATNGNGIVLGDDSGQGRDGSSKEGQAHDVPAPNPEAVQVPEGYRVEVVAQGLNFLTSIEFDDSGTMYLAEAGPVPGQRGNKPRVLRRTEDGQIETVIEQGLRGPVNDLLWHDGLLYLSHHDAVSVLDAEGKLVHLVTELPSLGDHGTNQLTVGPDGWIYFGQGTATNSGVVGVDNLKMGWLKKHPDFHDTPARDIVLTGHTYTTPNPLTDDESDEAVTGAFQPFGHAASEGTPRISGDVRSSGTVLRLDPRTARLEVYAWGLRNPYGLLWAGGKLYCTENGFDARGSRQIANDQEDLYEIKRDAWYGWPDFGSGIPVTDPRFKPEGQPQPEFLMASHPPVEKPLATFPPHSSITKLDAAPADGRFGHAGQLFIAFFGHMTPMTGTVSGEHGGHRVVRFDPATGEHETFFGPEEHHGQQDESEQGDSHHAEGEGHSHGGHMTAGPRRLIDVRFGPDGALYVVDYGVMPVDKNGPKSIPGTAVVWRVSRESSKQDSASQ